MRKFIFRLKKFKRYFFRFFGGEGGIRTRETGTTCPLDFESSAFSQAQPPLQIANHHTELYLLQLFKVMINKVALKILQNH